MASAPGSDWGIPDNRFINGDLVTNADGSVSVSGTVGERLPDGSLLTKDARIGHTFFPASWTREDVIAAGEDLFANGTYKKGGTMVKGPFRGVNMVGWLEKIADGSHTPSTFYPTGK